MPEPTDSRYTYFTRQSGLHSYDFEDENNKFNLVCTILLISAAVAALIFAVRLCNV